MPPRTCLLALAAVPLAACSEPPPLDDTSVDAAPDAAAMFPFDAPVGGAECATGTRTIYLNRGGGTYTPGADNSSTNTSQLVTMPRTLDAWNAGDVAFAALRACVAYNHRRYDVRVVDVDPGAAEHVEVVVAQSLAPLQFPAGTTGVAPAPTNCQPIRRAVVFYGAAAYGPAADGQAQLCIDVSRSVADALGLDEIFDGRSIMSWIEINATKTFLDEERPCGEYEARQCRCGGTTQNSHQRLVSVLGACPG